jgi:heptosyltransferase I
VAPINNKNSDDSAPASICVIRLSAIGDCCHTLPVLRTIQNRWPDAKITWIIGKTEYALMKGMDGFEFITFDKSGGLNAYREVRRQLNGRKFDLLLHMHPNMRANLISLMINARRKIGYDKARAKDYQWLFTKERIAEKSNQHVMDQLFGFSEALGIEERKLRWGITYDAAAKAKAAEFCSGSQPVVVLSPCANPRFRNFRNWRPELYAGVVDYLHEHYGAKVLITGGPSDTEIEFGRIIDATSKHKPLNLVGKTSLKELIAVIDTCDMVICPDSGPAHMATAMGTPAIGLFASTNPDRAGSYNSREWEVNRYAEATQKFLDKNVDELPWGQRVRTPDAMDLITPQDVCDACERLLQHLGFGKHT